MRYRRAGDFLDKKDTCLQKPESLSGGVFRLEQQVSGLVEHRIRQTFAAPLRYKLKHRLSVGAGQYDQEHRDALKVLRLCGAIQREMPKWL